MRLPLQDAYMKVESELMAKYGMTCLTRVVCVCATKALSGVSGSDVHRPTVTTRSRESAACPAMVSNHQNA